MIKPLIVVLALLGWARVVTVLDKDAAFFFQKRRLWNAVHITAGLMGFAIWLLVPHWIWFWVGLPVALALMIGAFVAYATVRNRSVPEEERWNFSLDTIRNSLLEYRREAATREATMRYLAETPAGGKQVKPVPLPDEPNYAPHMMLEPYIELLITRSAERLEMVSADTQFNVQLNVDGVGYPQPPIPARDAMLMLDYLKAQAGMDVSNRRRQRGTCEVEAGPLGHHELLINALASTRGISCTIDLDREKSITVTFDNLGLLEPQVKLLRPVIDAPDGTVLIASPSGLARRIVLYAVVATHDPYTQDINTLEVGVERDIEGVTQSTIGDEEPPKALRSRLLRDPDVLMVSHVVDEQSAKLIADAAQEGKRLYAGITADDTFQALQMWTKAVANRGKVADSLAAIVSPRMVRRLCPTCRQPYRPDDNALRKLNLPADRIQQLYKASGKVLVKEQPEQCPACFGLGFRGRVAVFEIMVLDDQARELIRAGQMEQLRIHLRRQKMLYLQEAALAQVVNGVTSISEVMRVLGGKQESDKSSAPAPK